MEGFKRGSDNTAGQVVKRARFEDPNSRIQELVVSSGGKGNSGQLVASIQRTSGLQTPIVRLDGHGSEVLDVQFSVDGDTLASSSTDKTINLWRTYGDNSNFGVLKGQQGAVTSIAFPGSSSSPHIFAASTDKTVATFDMTRGQIARRHRGHKGIVNCVDVTRGGRQELVASAADDGLVKIWDIEAKDPIDEIELGYPVTAIKWSEDGQQLFIGGIDNDIHVRRLLS
jgi:Prp8 binding protein